MGKNCLQGLVGGGRGGGGGGRGVCPGSGAFLPHSGPPWALVGKMGGPWRPSGRGWRPWDPPDSLNKHLSGPLRTLSEASALPAALLRGRADCVQPPVCISVQRPRKRRVASLRFQRLLQGIRPAPVVLSGHGAPSALPAPNPRLAWASVRSWSRKELHLWRSTALCDSLTIS